MEIKQKTKKIAQKNFLPILDSISVDGSCLTGSRKIEFQAVHTETGEVFFRMGPFEDGTSNIAEFLAIAQTLEYCDAHGINLPIYSDSWIAINWIRNKFASTYVEETENNKILFELLEHAEKWLEDNPYHNEVLKWHTRSWGENPADFGRKFIPVSKRSSLAGWRRTPM